MLYNFIFIFFKEYFFTHCVTLFKARKSCIFEIFFSGQLYRLEEAKRNTLGLTMFQNHIDYRKFDLLDSF